MCEPYTIAMIAVTAAAGLSQASAQRDAGIHAQEVANYNAKVGEQQAKQVEEIGNIEEQQQRTRVRQLIARQNAAAGSSGAEVGVGSFADITDDTIMMGEADAQTIRANAAKEAWGYRTGATLTRAEGRFARRAGNMNATGTLLTTAGKTFGMGMDAYQGWKAGKA